MPYNSGTGAYERRATTVIDATPDGDTVAVAIDVKLDQGIDDYVVDLNHHNTNGNHYPAPTTADDSRYLDQSPAGVVSWKDGVPAPDAALKDFSNVASGAIANDKLAAIAPSKITQDSSNRFMTDAERAKVAALKTSAYLDILGTVSQSGGVPTGSIIERGSNANGEYARFADGTQICTINISDTQICTTPAGPLYTALSPGTWTYPASFTSVPVVCGGTNNVGRWMTTQPEINTSSYKQTSFTSSSTGVASSLVAVGHWF